jgi:hypothetical protein
MTIQEIGLDLEIEDLETLDAPKVNWGVFWAAVGVGVTVGLYAGGALLAT